MSTVKTTNITHASNSGTANVVLDSSGNVTVGNELHSTPSGNANANGFSIIPADGTTASHFKVLGNSNSGGASGRNGGAVFIDTNYYLTSSLVFNVSGRGTSLWGLLGSGDVQQSATGFVGSNSTSTGNTAYGFRFQATGAMQAQVTASSYGWEHHLVNNTYGTSGSIALLDYRVLNTTEGKLAGDSSGISISNNSDYRKKERITDLTGSLAVIDSLKPRQYYYREGFHKPTRAFAGFIAHEVQGSSLPQLTIGDKDAVVTQADKDKGLYSSMSVGDPIYQTVKYSDNELITHLVNAVKELKAKVAALEAA